jgi:hypothetical protein
MTNRGMVSIEKPCNLMKGFISRPSISHLGLLIFRVVDSRMTPHMQHTEDCAGSRCKWMNQGN